MAQPTTNTPGEAHENGDVEHAHFRFKGAVDQALRLRGHRDFVTRTAYGQWLYELVRQRNRTRHTRFAEEQVHLRPLPPTPLAPYRELRVRVSRFSTIHVVRNTYSVPSRFIGTVLTVRVRAECVELYVGATVTLTIPRLSGRQQHQIDYRHSIWSLVRKPGAFAAYRYRDELFPTLIFRQAYDRLQAAQPHRADREYLRIRYLAASTTETDVAVALGLLLETGGIPTFDATRAVVQSPLPLSIPQITTAPLDFTVYDHLLTVGCAHD